MMVIQYEYTYSVSICSVFAIVLFGSGSIDFVDKFITTVVESAFSCSSMTTVGDVLISRRIKADSDYRTFAQNCRMQPAYNLSCTV
jgi:hypothetical protein